MSAVTDTLDSLSLTDAQRHHDHAVRQFASHGDHFRRWSLCGCLMYFGAVAVTEGSQCSGCSSPARKPASLRVCTIRMSSCRY